MAVLLDDKTSINFVKTLNTLKSSTRHALKTDCVLIPNEDINRLTNSNNTTSPYAMAYRYVAKGH